MRMSEELVTVETDRPDIVQLIGIGLTGVLLIVALIFFLQALFYREQARQELLKTAPNAEWQQYRQEEERALSSYRYIDKEKGVVGIPIEVAMRRLAEDAPE